MARGKRIEMKTFCRLRPVAADVIKHESVIVGETANEDAPDSPV